jgi:hypothetical protein
MKTTVMTITFIAILAIVAGGVWALRHPAEAGKPTAGPTTTKVAPAPEIKLAPGEQDDPDDRMIWQAPDGSTIALTIVNRDDEVVVRAFTAAGAVDVTKPSEPGGEGDVLVRTKTGLMLVSTDIVGRAPEVGALTLFTITRLEWNAAKKQLAATETWSCDESEVEECHRPAWAKEVTP